MKKFRILVVEDDMRLAATLERVLAAEGHEVERVGDGLEALKRAREPSAVRWILDGGVAALAVIVLSGATLDYRFFSFAEMLEYLSEDMTLFPGDIISGGTTSGTILDTTPVVPDLGRDPSAFLHVGDVIEISNPVLGTLRNPVIAKPGS